MTGAEAGDTMTGDNYYELIGVAPTATKDEVRAAYQERSAKVQEEQTTELGAKRPREQVLARTRDELTELRRAWQVLSDPYQRGRYDESIGATANGREPDDGDPPAVDEAGSEVEVVAAAEEPAPVRMTAKERRQARLEMMSQPVTTESGTVHEIAAPGRRAMAAIIDLIITAALISAIVSVAYYLANAKGSAGYYAATFSTLGVVLLYWVFPTVRTGQTLGKRLTYIMVVDRATGHLATRDKLVIQYLVPSVLATMLPQLLAPIVLMAGFSFMLTRDSVSLLDRLGKTVVVVARYQPEKPVRRR